MDVVKMYDYYYEHAPKRKFYRSCRFTLCDNSIVVRRLLIKAENNYDFNGPLVQQDVLKYMLYNVSGDTGFPSYYSCCMECAGQSDDDKDHRHTCNAIPIMIGSDLEKRLLSEISRRHGLNYNLVCSDKLHDIFKGSYLINGTFYYSVFRESNNNKMCHNFRSKDRGEETVCYFYDLRFNRGHKVYTGQDGKLCINNRDGKQMDDVNEDMIAALYAECRAQPQHYTPNVRVTSEYFQAVKRQGTTGIDLFKNKIYTNYTVGLNCFLDKLAPSVLRIATWNTPLMVGKVNIGISQRLSYLKSKSEVKKQNEQRLKMCSGDSTGYLVESQRRRNVRKSKPSENADLTDAATDGLGSNEIKTVSLIEKLENGERNGPSIFNQVGVSYLPYICLLSSTVQKLQVEHVHAESSKTVPDDAYGFICMKYMGNISTAGKNMLFTDRVAVSYGHVDDALEICENGLKDVAESVRTNGCSFSDKGEFFIRYARDVHGHGDRFYRIVLNNAVTVYVVNASKLTVFMLWVKQFLHRFAWTSVVGRFVCIHYYEGVPMIEIRSGDRFYDTLIAHCWHQGDRSLITLNGGVAAEILYFNRLEVEKVFELHVDWATALQRCHGCAVKATNALMIDMLKPSRLNHNVMWKNLLRTSFFNSTAFLPPDNKRRRLWQTKAVELKCHMVQGIDHRHNFDLEGHYDDAVSKHYSKVCAVLNKFASYAKSELTYDRFETLWTESFNSGLYNIPAAVSCRDMELASALAKQLNQYSEYTAPAKRSVSVNARKSACVNVYYREAADMIRGFNVFVDPNGYERKMAAHLERVANVPFRVTMSSFNAMRSDPDNCPQPQCGRDPSLVNFYMLRTAFADISGFNVEDANVIDSSIDLSMSFSYSFSLTFVDKSKRGVDVQLADPRSCAQVCSWNKGKALGVLFIVCVIHAGDCDPKDIQFPPFRKLQVHRNSDNNYVVYMIRNEAVLIRAVEKYYQGTSPVHHEAGPYSADLYPPLRDAFDLIDINAMQFIGVNCERIISVDIRVHGSVNRFDGIKVVNAFGQKGLAILKPLDRYIYGPPDAPLQLVMNNCSFVSRAPLGQFTQMSKNLPLVVNSRAGEPTMTGYTAVFFTESEPTTKTCLVRFDEMLRSVIVTMGLANFLNVKSSQDNIYNPHGLLCPPHTRQILALYPCYNVQFRLQGDLYEPFSKRHEVLRIFDLYVECQNRIEALKSTAGCAKVKLDENKKSTVVCAKVKLDENKKSTAVCAKVKLDDNKEFGYSAM